MGNLFSVNEVVEMGVQIEKNGKDFYMTLAAQTKSATAKEMFLFLAGEEAKHIASFQAVLDSVEKYEPSESYPDEYFSYMNALAAEHVFTKKDMGATVARGIKTDSEAVRHAYKFEKDSIAFFEGMKKVVRKGDHAIIDGLIKQEEDHITKLSEIEKKM